MNSKPGYKTTEFWLSLASIILGVVMSSGAVDPNNKALGLAASILGALGYTEQDISGRRREILDALDRKELGAEEAAAIAGASVVSSTVDPTFDSWAKPR